jgi:outer membrane lipoprotein-sorting protein
VEASHDTKRSKTNEAIRVGLLLIFLNGVHATVMAADNMLPALTAEDVVNRMLQADEKRLAEFQGYTATRRYSLENKRVNKSAEIMVRVTCTSAGSRSFAVLSESGSSIIRNRVLRKLMDAEAEASQQDLRERNRIVPANYDFRLAGSETTDGRPAHILEIVPKTPNRFLIRGRIWVDAEEYAISRIEGTPAKNPSFWTRSIQIVHCYGKTGPFWLPTLNHSRAEARIFGSTEVTIEYFDYLLNGAVSSPEQTPRMADYGERH